MRRISQSFTIAIFFSVTTAASAFADTMRVGGTGIAIGILRLLADGYAVRTPGDRVEIVPSLGSTGGLAALADGALQLAAIARPLKTDERKQLADVPFFETPIIFVSSHPDRQKLTTADVVAIHQGSLMRWPDGSEIRPILRLKGDAATQFLVNNIFGMWDAIEALRKRPDIPVAATDQDNAELAANISNSFASMTLVQFLTEKPQLRAVELDGVISSVELTRADPFLLKLDLHLAWHQNAPAIVDRFLHFVKSGEGQEIIGNHGGVPLKFRIVANQ
jgi:phosphate transport system substrate-binding protein